MLNLFYHNFNCFLGSYYTPSALPFKVCGTKTPITNFTNIIQNSCKKVKIFFAVQEKGSALTPSLKAKQNCLKPIL